MSSSLRAQKLAKFRSKMSLGVLGVRSHEAMKFRGGCSSVPGLRQPRLQTGWLEVRTRGVSRGLFLLQALGESFLSSPQLPETCQKSTLAPQPTLTRSTCVRRHSWARGCRTPISAPVVSWRSPCVSVSPWHLQRRTSVLLDQEVTLFRDDLIFFLEL